MAVVDDAIVRALEAMRLKMPVARLFERAPAWIRKLNTRDIRNRDRLVDSGRLQESFVKALALLRARRVDIGDYLEFGVYNGTSLSCMYRALQAMGSVRSRLFGFDSFEGLPSTAASDSGGHWRPGEFKSSIEFAWRVLTYEGVDRDRVTLVKGFFDATLTDQRRSDLGIRKASVILMDCDLYQSTKEALRFSGPAITDEAVILFDDWFPLAQQGLGEKKAFDEWLAQDATLESQELFDFPYYGKAFLVSRVPARATVTA